MCVVLATHGHSPDPQGNPFTRAEARQFLLWLLAVVLVVCGIVTIVRGGLVLGIVLIVVGLLVGPGGVSIFSR